jgi:hypothetical protein
VTDRARRQGSGVGRMSTRTATWLAWALAALCVAMFVTNAVLNVLVRSTRSPGDGITFGTVGEVLGFMPLLAFPLVGALIASKRPHNPIGWICLAVGLLFMVLGMSEYYSAYGVARPGSLSFPVAVGSLSNWLWVPAVGLLGIYLLLLFPDGGLPSRRWRPLAWFSGVVLVLLSVGFGLSPGQVASLDAGTRNPFGIEALPWLLNAVFVVLPLLPLCMLASALSLVLRYRRSGREVRQQIKWIAFAASFMVLAYLLPSFSQFIGEPQFLFTVVDLSFAGVPVAIGFAVLKYRLYDIDVVINRALVYGSLTAMLLALYFGGVTTTQAIFRTLTGQEQQPQLAVVVSTLVIAALFNPLRRSIQSFIDRRFYRRKYDARKTLEEFSAILREGMDLDALSAELVEVVRDTMQPELVSLWLRSDTSESEQPN